MRQIQTFLIFISALCGAMPLALASNLPACPSDTSVYRHKCFGSETWPGGDKYVGEYKDNNRHGQGTYTHANGSKYVGAYRDNNRHGRGTFIFGSDTEWAGDKYVGAFKDGKSGGQGTYTKRNGDVWIAFFVDGQPKNGTFIYGEESEWSGDEYIGGFKDWKRHGQGTYITSNGRKYDGEFKEGQFSGQGTLTIPIGQKWVGEFKEWELNGFGIHYDPNGKILAQGIWKDNEFQYAQSSSQSPLASNLPACPSDVSAYWDNCFGTGFYSGDKYVGEYRHDSANGQGNYTFGPNSKFAGDQYVGGFRDSKKHGLGTYSFSNGDKYVGEFRDDLYNGQGTYTFGPNSEFTGDKYVGEYRNGKATGQGTYTFADGTKYVGEFRDGLYNGQGTYTFGPDSEFAGDKYVGEFGDGKYNGQGTYTFGPDSKFAGVKYVGSFKDGLLNGYAVHYGSDGTILKQGIWKNDEFQYAQNSPSTPPPSSDNKPAQDDSQIVSAPSGSGFAVSNDGYLVTNNHVIEGCQKVFVHRRGKKYETDIVAYDTRNDLALLKGNFQPDVALPLSSAKPYLAQDIYVSGYPFGANISSSVKVTKGIISSLTGIGNNLAEMQIDAALQSGNSGGPILDEYGNVVGVAVAKLDVKFALENFGAIPENTNFGVKANIVEALLDANGVNYKQGKAVKPSGTEFSNILSNGTYYISCWMTLAQIEAMKTKKVMFSDLQ